MSVVTPDDLLALGRYSFATVTTRLHEKSVRLRKKM